LRKSCEAALSHEHKRFSTQAIVDIGIVMGDTDFSCFLIPVRRLKDFAEYFVF